MAYLSTGLTNGRPASHVAMSSSTSSLGLANLNLPEPRDPLPQEWRLPHEHKMEKREPFGVRNVSLSLPGVCNHTVDIDSSIRNRRNQDIAASSCLEYSILIKRPGTICVFMYVVTGKHVWRLSKTVN